MKINVEDVIMKKCNINNLDEIYKIQSIMVEAFREDEKGYYIPDTKEYLKKMLDEKNNYGWFYGAYYKDEIIGYICLSISPRVKLLADMIPNLEGTFADIDGITVIPEYRGNKISIAMLKYIEEQARNNNIDNLLAEITYGNVYSYNNFKKMNYDVVASYVKDGNINRYLVRKNIKK